MHVPAMPQSWGPITQTGMTLRDYFAAAVVSRYLQDYSAESSAQAAYAMADAMLAEREKERK